jgi:Tol biopolymer transport system component
MPYYYDDVVGVYLRDTCTGAPAGCVRMTKRLDLGTGGNPLNMYAYRPSISADGSRVAFSESRFDPFSNSWRFSIYVSDTCVGNTVGCTPRLINVATTTTGAHPNGGSYGAVLSGDGKYVVFNSDATDLVPNDTNGVQDVFRRRIF